MIRVQQQPFDAGQELAALKAGRTNIGGTVMFLGDLIRYLSLPLRLDFMGVSSYREGTESRELVFTKELKLEVRGHDVLVVDDILDTGKTLLRVTEKLRALKPRSLKACVLLDKKARRVENIEADYVGFSIPDLFVVGYGLDYAERYRNLPFVGVLKPEMYSPDSEVPSPESKVQSLKTKVASSTLKVLAVRPGG